MHRQIAIVFVALLLPLAAFAANEGEVTFLEGSATRTTKKGEKSPLSMGSKVAEGDTLECAGKLEITLPDQSIVRLAPGSKLVLDEAAFEEQERSFRATLMLGKAWSKVTSLFSKEQDFEIRTERAVAGVRGTIFQVNAKKNKAVLVKVYAGAVAVAGTGVMPTKAKQQGPRVQVPGPQQVTKQQWEKIVTAMMQVSVKADGTPGEPTRCSATDDWSKWNRERDEGP